MSSPNELEVKTDEVDLGSYLSRIRKNWIIVLVGLGLGLVLAISYQTFWPNKWEARTALLMAQSTPSISSPLANLALGESDPLLRIKGIIESKRVISAVSVATGVKEEELRKNIAVSTDKQRNQIRISWNDENRDLAYQIVLGTVIALEKIDGDIGLSVGARRLAIINSQLKEAYARKKEIETQLVAVGKDGDSAVLGTGLEASSRFALLASAKIRLASLDRQISSIRRSGQNQANLIASGKAAFPGSQALRQKYVDARIEFESISANLTSENAEYRRAASRLATAKSEYDKELQSVIAGAKDGASAELISLMAGREGTSAEVDALKRLTDGLPEKTLRSQNLLAMFTQVNELIKRAELQRADAEVTVQMSNINWSRLDEPYLVEKPVNKDLRRNLSIGLFLGLLFGSVAAAARKS